MDAGIVGEFGVKRGGHGFSLADGDRIGAFGGEDFYAFSDVFDFRGAYEDHFQRGNSEQALADRAVDLASVGVAPDADVEGAESFLLRVLYLGGEQDCSGTGSERGLDPNELLELFESFFAEKFQEGAGFSTWNDQSIDLVELLWLFDQYDFSAEFLETAAVGVKVSLKCQDSNFHVFGWYVDLRFTLVSFDITGEFDSAVFLGAITHRMGRRTLPTRHRRLRWLFRY